MFALVDVLEFFDVDYYRRAFLEVKIGRSGCISESSSGRAYNTLGLLLFSVQVDDFLACEFDMESASAFGAVSEELHSVPEQY